MRNPLLLLAACGLACAQQDPPPARFHHLHLNSADPAAAMEWYLKTLPSEKRKFAGLADALFTHQSWLLFTRHAAAKSEVTSGIWHMGWGGGADMRETHQKHLDMGTKFATPLTDISDQCDGRGGNGRFLFAYIDAPDHALIELNTTPAGNYRFGHLHLVSEDPIAAGEWYMKHFGLTRRGTGPLSREKRFRCGRQTAPNVSLMMDDVNVIIYPVEFVKVTFPEVWKDRTEIEPSQGHSIDHVGFGVPDLDAALARLRAAGVKITAEPRSLAGGKIRYAFIEGPDKVRIELIEDKAN